MLPLSNRINYCSDTILPALCQKAHVAVPFGTKTSSHVCEITQPSGLVPSLPL